jgi:hypothetical protein
MNRKQFLILLSLVVVVGAAGLLVHRNANDSWRGAAAIGGKLLPDLSVNDVAQITIKSGAGEVNLARENNLWRVRERAGYPADFARISELLIKLADLKIVQNEDLGPSQLGRFELLPPGPGADTGTAVDLNDSNGRPLGSLLLGKPHLQKPAANPQFGGMGGEEWPNGRYVMTAARSVALISDPLESVQPKPEAWLNKDFLNVEKPRSIAVRFAAATNSWKLTRASETGDWQLADSAAGEKLDSTRISSVTSPFGSATFEDVAPLSSNRLSYAVLTVDTFDGFSYVSRVGTRQGDNYPVSFSVAANLPATRPPAADEKPADKTRLDQEFQTRQKTLAEKLAKESAITNWIYQIPAYTLDELLKSRPQLLVEAGTNAVPPLK